jgi:phosphatidylserine/phosphatidylglycerophosphate/cardiolipin synthase-like enzyme
VATFVLPIAANPALAFATPRRRVLDESGHRAVLLTEVTGQGNVSAVAPITAYVKPIQVGSDFLLELSPLPSPADAPAFRELGARGATAPTFYFGGPGVDQTTVSGTVGAGETITTGPAVLIGATLGPFALAPREWARVLREAMAAAGEVDLGPWADFETALTDGPALYVLRHTGQPPALNQMQFDVELPGDPASVVSIDDRGDLAAAAPGVFAPGARVRLRTPANGVPYHSAYDSDLRSSPELDAPADDRWFEPSGFPTDQGTILCTDLAGWFAERPPGVSLPRWYTGNRVEPLLDGIETFARLWEDLQPLRNEAGARLAPDGTRFGAWLACWTFEDFELVAGLAESKFVDLAKEIHRDGNGYQIRLLASKLVQFRGDESDEEKLLMVVVMMLAIGGIGVGSLLLEKIDMGAAPETWVVLHLAAILLAMAASTQLVDAITDALDGSKAVLEALRPAGGVDRYALPSRYPARFSDNPTSTSFPADLMTQLTAVERIGVWHNKMQMLALPGPDGATAPTYVAYFGGVDVNDNRVDAWGHRWPKDYHDVHARMTGPAVADLFQTFYDRWDFDTGRLVDDEGPAAPNSCPRVTPVPGDTATQSLSQIGPAGDDIVQVARTLYRPAPAHANEAFPFAPQGEATVHDSILRAIRSAREYIYLEDQFMVPPDSADEGDEIIEALVGAATRCKALIMVFPEGSGDPQWLFGVERRNLLMARLQAAWGAQPGRHFLPLIHTRPLLGPADRIAARGRTVLKSPIDDAIATQVRVADGVRVPDTPCWAWIEGELVLVHDSNVDTLSGESTLEVVRGPNGHHQDVWARAHPAGAPVTFTKVDDVFIHAKLVLIDDVFASIGSVNMNRRSMYHDGEISAQVVPGRLRAAVDNPVRSLRCRIWADHLGLAVDAAEAELADPLAALELFRRPRAAGNPLVPFQLLDDMQPVGPGVETATAFAVLGTIVSQLASVGGDLGRHALFSTVIDPTTSLDPFHDTPPFG